MSNGMIFLTGALVGGVVGAGITYICMADAKDKMTIEELEARHENALKMSEDELREYYCQQLQEIGGAAIFNGEDIPREMYESLVNPVNDDDEEEIDEEEDEDDEYDEDEDLSPVEVNPNPYVISEDEFDNNDDYSTCTIHYYKEDEVFADEDNDIFEGISTLFSSEIIDEIKSTTEEAMYVRVEEQMVDYEILIFNDSYAHAVEGEDELGDMADEED